MNKNIWKEYSFYYNKFTPKFQKELLNYTNQNMSGDILDAGVGVGKLIEYLEKNENINSIMGIDSNDEMLKFAKEKSKKSIIKKLNIEDILKLNQKFDSISSINVIYSLDNPIKFLEDSYTLLNKKGKLILSSQIRNFKSNSLIEEIKNEFGNDDDFNKYLEINKILTSQNFNVKNYEINEIETISKLIGFKILDKKSSHYLNNNFTFIFEKK